MKRYGSREILDVVLKDVVTGEPKVYLESLTTSSIEIAGETVYARGGRGNPRLIGWDSDKDINMSMEDALISKESLGVLVGAEFVAGTRSVHEKEGDLYVEDGAITLKFTPDPAKKMFFYRTIDGSSMGERLTPTATTEDTVTFADVADGDRILADYYRVSTVTTKTIDVTTDVFPGTYMLEGTTLWRDENGNDVEAKFTIPKLKILPGFTIPMANSGDPQTFTFSCDILKDSKSKTMFTIELMEDEE